MRTRHNVDHGDAGIWLTQLASERATQTWRSFCEDRNLRQDVRLNAERRFYETYTYRF